MDKVHRGIGDRLSTFIQWMTAFFGGIIAGFVYDWRLTLVMLGASPFMMAGVGILYWVSIECPSRKYTNLLFGHIQSNFVIYKLPKSWA